MKSLFTIVLFAFSSLALGADHIAPIQVPAVEKYAPSQKAVQAPAQKAIQAPFQKSAVQAPIQKAFSSPAQKAVIVRKNRAALGCLGKLRERRLEVREARAAARAEARANGRAVAVFSC